MILVIAGTKDGRELAGLLARQGYKAMVSVVSEYGRQLAEEPNLAVHTGPLDCAGLTQLLQESRIALVVDASHPYAVNASKNAQGACQQAHVPYLRYERPCAALPDYNRLYVAADAAAAAKAAASLGSVVFLTTGSRTLRIFKTEPALREHRLVARVLPEPSVLAECIALGFMARDIIAMQGPFSHELNKAMFRQTGAEVIVTKNSGEIGGSDSKFTAAMELGLPIVVVGRPPLVYEAVATSFEEVLDFIKEAF